MDTWKFVKLTFPYVMASFFLFLLINLFVKNEKIEIAGTEEKYLTHLSEEKQASLLHCVLYFILFLLCIASVTHLIDYRFTLTAVILIIWCIDRKLLTGVDYFLLLTFVSFFIFAGNLSKIEYIRIIIEKLVVSREFIASILLSQLVSNVPSAILLSNFTSHGKNLILGTNIGGLGTIIASLASLISYKIYCKTDSAKSVLYLAAFSLANVGIMVLLISVNSIIS